MSTSVWVVLAIVAVPVLYVLCMRVFFRESRELEKQIDPSKLRPWHDDD